MRRVLALVAASSAFVLLVPTIVLFPSRAEAATFSWSASSGDWSYGVNWSGGTAPTSAATNTLAFSGATAWSSSDDIAGSFSLNSLNLAGAGAGTIADASTGSSTGLNFASNGATTPTIAMNATGNVLLASSMTITNPLTITVPSGAGILTLGTSAGGLGSSNWLTGAGSLTINNSSVNPVILMGANSFSGSVSVSSGSLQLGNANALAQSAVIVSSSVGLTFSPSIGAFNVGNVAGNGEVTLQDTSGAAINLIIGANNGSTTNNLFVHGTGTLTKVGNGNMTLTSGNNNWTGDLAMNGGSVSLANFNPAPGGGCPFSYNGGALVWTDASNAANGTDHPQNFIGSGTIDVTTAAVYFSTFTSVMSGTGALTLNGPGELFLTGGTSGVNWSGNIIVNKGTLMESIPSLPNNSGLTVQNLGQWEIFGGTANSENFSIGSGTVTLSGTGTTGYSGALLYAPSTNAFNVVVNNSIALASTSSIIVGDTSTTAGTLTLNGNIKGTGGLIKDYVGSLTAGRSSESTFFNNSQGILALGGSNTYTGPTIINAGTIVLQSASALPDTAATISTSNGSTLNLGGNNATITGLLSSVAGGATSGGTVTNSGATNSTLSIATLNGKTTSYAGVIRNGASHNIALVVSGSGDQILAGVNTYTGNTTINGGTLGLGSAGSINSSPLISMVNGTTLDVSAQPAGYTLASGQTLTGTGNLTVSGSLTAGAGVTLLTPGFNLVRTLNVGGLTLNNGSQLSMDLTSSGTGDLINVSSNNALTINGGSIALYQANGFVPVVDRGTYTLMNYQGTLAGAASNLTVDNPVPGLANTYAFNSNPGTPGTLTVTISGGNYWTGFDVSNGSSNWNDANNWSVSAPSNSQALAFSGVTGLSNSNDLVNLNAASVNFDSTSGQFVLSGNSIQLSGPINNGSASTQTFNTNIGLLANQAVNAAGNIIFNGAISDGGAGYGITVNASTATVELTAANTYSGVTSVSSGTLDLLHSLAVQNSTVAPIGSAAIVFDQSVGGAFTFGGLGGAAPIALTDNGSNPVSLTVGNNNASVAYSGVLSGAGSLTKIGTGTQTLSGLSTFNGGVTFNGGAISVNSLSTGGTTASALGEGPANGSGQSWILNGGMLTYNGASIDANATYSAAAINANVNLNAGGGTWNTINGFWGFSGSLSGAGTLTVTDTLTSGGSAGQQVFFNTAGTNASPNFTGGIVLNQGGNIQYRTDAANAFGTTATVYVNFGGIFSNDNGANLGGSSGTGGYQVHGQNLLVNPFVLNGGSLATQGVSVDYSGPLTITGGTTSYLGDYVNSAGTITLGGALAGAGTVDTIGGVSITLSGATSGFAGTWAAMNNTATANVSTNFVGNANGSPGATWTTSNADFGINNSGVVNFGALSGSSGTIQNGVASTSSTLSVGALGASTTYGGLITNGAGTLGLTVNGPGTLTLTNSEKYTGVTTVNGGELIVAGSLSTSSAPTVNGGTLQYGNGTAPLNLATNVLNNSMLIFANAGAGIYANQISGGGTVVIAGPGSVSLATSQGYTGRTIVNGGTLAVGAVTPAPLQLGFNGTPLDSSANHNNATLFNSPSYTTGPLPATQAISFNGTNQFAVVPYSTSLSLSSAYTVSLWEQGTLVSSGVTAASQGGPALFSTRNGANNDFDLQVNSDGLHADIGNGTSFLTSAANATVSLGSVWNMITYAVNTNGYSIYVNGQQVSSGTLSGTPELFTSSAASASIGSQEAAGASYGAGFDSGYFNGAISNVDVFSSALSAAQVAALYNSSSGAVLPAGSLLNLAAGATLNLGNAETVGSLAGAGTVTNSIATAPTLTVGTDNSSQTFSGVLQDGAGNLSVVKTGSGMWTLAGNNTYSGNTTLSGGTLQLGNGGTTGSLGAGGLTMGNAWLSFNRSDSGAAFSYAITSGTVSQDGGGMTTLALNNSYSGGTFINNGALQVGNSGSTGSLGTGPVVNNGTLVLMRSDAFLSFPGALSGAGAIYQNGGGTATLSGPAAGFTGPIFVNSGNLYLNSANSTPYITVAPGAVLGGKGSVSAGTAELQNGAGIEAGQGGSGNLTVAGLLLDNVANININNLLSYSSTNLNSAVPAITVTGSGALSAQTQQTQGIQINLGGAAFFNTVPQDARILAYTGSANLGELASLTVANNLNVNINGINSNRAVFSFLPLSADPGYIDLQFSVSYPVWSGAGNGVWDNNVNQSPQNWKLATSGTGNGTPTNFQVNDQAVFDDSAGSGHTVVSLNGTGSVDPSSVTFNNNVLGYTLSGANAIEGGAIVTMNGSGPVAILNANTYYGGTTINNGLLNIGNQFALGSASNYVANGAFFTINGGSINNVTGGALTTDNYPINWNGGFTFVGSNPLDLGAGGVTLTSSAAAVNVSGSTLEMDGPIGDGGAGYGFTQTGAGVLVLTASNTYLGPTVVSGGTLQVGNGGSGASIGSTSNVVLAANTLLLFDNNDSQTLPASISGSGSMIQIGAGLLNLTNSNTYTGGTTVASGSLELSFNGPAGTLAPGSTVTVNGGAELLLNASNALGTGATYTNLTVNSGGLVFANSGCRIPLYSATITGGTLASAAGNGDGNGNYSLGGTLSAASDAFGNPAVISATQVSLVANSVLNVTHNPAASPADMVVTSAISSLPSGYGLTIQGNGFTQFAGANTYNGGTTVLGGTLQLASGAATLSANSGGLTVAGGALLDINGVSTSVAGLNGGGTIDNVAGMFGAAPSLTIGNGNASGTFSGTIQNSSGSTKVVKTGTGTEILSGTNTYAGGTAINGGVLNFAPSALGSGPVAFGGGTLQWATGNTVDVSTSPGITAIASGKVANLDSNGNNVTFNTGLSGAGGLTKIGAGTLTLAAADTFSGATSITGGTLDLANSNALQNSTANVSIGNSLVLSGAATSAVTLGGLSGSGAFNLGVAAFTVGGNNATTTYSGVLGGGSSLTKTGTGTLTLNTPNISGAVNITGGVLAVQNNTVAIKVGGAAVSASDGPNGAVAGKWNNLLGGSPSGSNLGDNFGLGSAISMNAIATPSGGTFAIGGNTDPLLANYVFTTSGAITVNLTGIPYSSYSIYAFSSDATAGHQNALAMGGNTYYFSATSASTFSQITNSNSASHPVGNYAVATGLSGASQTLTVSGTPDTGFSGFEIVNTTNTMASSPATISDGGTFNMNGGMQTIASLNSTDGNGSKVVLGNGNLTIGNAGASTWDGAISGSGGQVALQGAGSMLFTGSNTYTGPTTVSGGGTLQLGDGAVNNGSVAGNVALVNNSAVIFANPSAQSYSGVISGTGSLTKNGAGTLYLSGNHTYSGPTVINTGMVQLNQLSAVSGFGANTVSGTAGGAQTTATVSTNNGTWTLNTYGGYGTGLLNTPVTGGSLDLTDGTGADSGFGYKAARTAFFNSPVPVNTSFKATFTYTASDPGGADGSTYGANYDNGFAFVIQNSGTGALSGAGRGMGFGNNPEAFPNPTSDEAAPAIQHSAAIAYDFFPYYGNPNSGLFNVAPSVLGAGTGYNVNGGTGSSAENATGNPLTPLSVFGGSSNSYVGANFNIPGDPINMTVSYNAATKVLTWSGTDTVQSLTFSETQSGVNLTSVTGGTSAYVGFSGGDGEFGSTQTITNFNFAALLPNASNVLPSTTPLFVAAGGTLDLYGVNQTVGDLSGAGAVTNTYNQSIATLTTGGDGTTQTFSGTLQDGGGSLALHVVSPGGLVLTGQNAYSGATTINTGGTLQLGNGQSGNDGSINGAGGGVVDNGMLAYNLFGAQTAGYKITGSGAVTKTGGGTLTLANSGNTYRGGTNVLQGLLIVAPGANALPNGPLFVGAPSGSGSLDLEDNSPTITTLGGSGVIGNGASTGGTSNLTVTSGGTWAGTIQDGGFGGGDQVALVVSNGTLTLSGMNDYSAGTYVPGGQLIVTNNEGIEDGTNLLVGFGTNDSPFAAVIPAEASSPASTQITSAAVPEPGTLALVVAALSGAAVYRRLRRRSKTAAAKGI